MNDQESLEKEETIVEFVRIKRKVITNPNKEEREEIEDLKREKKLKEQRSKDMEE